MLMNMMNLGHMKCMLSGYKRVQIGQHHIVDASSEEEVCTLARYMLYKKLIN